MDKDQELPDDEAGAPSENGDAPQSDALPDEPRAEADDVQRIQPPPMFEPDPAPPPEEEREDSGPHTGSLHHFMKRTSALVEERDQPSEEAILPRQPRTLVEVGLSKAFLTDLALKIIHYSGTPSMAQLNRRLGLAPHIVQQVISLLTEDRLVEVLSQSDLYTGNYRYRLSERGTRKAAEALERSRYAGPAPVTAEQYSEVIRRLHAYKQEFSRARIRGILNELVLSGEVADSVARALYSGKAGIFYGPSGNGKTTILERFATDQDGMALVPHAVYAYGQVIRVFDQSIHEPLEDMDGGNMVKDDTRMDHRWVLARRPAVVLGAEIGRESLDLTYDPQSRFYQAPPHIKAQGGVLVVDDFGRHKIESKELLTRWLIPLERGWDTLSLVTGEKLTVPFGIHLLFGTNININKLGDDSLLRRILYKVEIPNPRPDEFTEIMRQICRHKRVLVADGALDYMIQGLYNEAGLNPCASYARDLLDILIESASFDGRDPVLDKEFFDRVFRLFLTQGAEEQENEDA